MENFGTIIIPRSVSIAFFRDTTPILLSEVEKKIMKRERERARASRERERVYLLVSLSFRLFINLIR